LTAESGLNKKALSIHILAHLAWPAKKWKDADAASFNQIFS
jgi:hypothetical protein